MAQYRLQRPWAAATWGGSFDQLRRDMDTLFNRFGDAQSHANGWQGAFPLVNLYETADAYMMTAELPGVEPDDIHVSVEGATVNVQGERKIDYPTQEGSSLHRRERQAGTFQRAFELPAVIDTDKVEAVHKNGVLMLRLPKTAEHQPRQISVQAS